MPVNKLAALAWAACLRGISYGDLSATTTEAEREAIYKDYERELARRAQETKARIAAAKERRKPARPTPPPFPEAEVRELYYAKLTDPEIGHRLGIAAWRIRDWRYKNDLPGNVWKKERNLTNEKED